MKKTISYTLAVLFTGSFLFLGFNSQNQTKAAGTSIPNPSILGFISDIGKVNDVVVPTGSTKAYLASEDFGLVIVDVTDKSNPKVLGSQHPVDKAARIAISTDKNLAIVRGSDSSTHIVDISDPTYPKVLSSLPFVSSDVAFVDDYGYLVAGGDVKVVNLVNPSDPQVVATLITPSNTSGIAVSGNKAVIVSLVPLKLQVLDISNPASPTIVGSTADLGSNFGQVAVSGNLALVSNRDLRLLQIIDISIPSNPVLRGSTATGETPAGVVASGNTAYVSAGSAGLKIINISNPDSLLLISTYNSIPMAASISGGIAYLAEQNQGLEIVDISVPTSPVLIKRMTHSATGNHLAISTSRNLAIVAGASRGTDIVDINDSLHPKVLSSISGVSGDATFVNDNLAYILSDTDVKVVNLTNPSSPQVVTTLITPGIAAGIAVSGNTAVVLDAIFSGGTTSLLTLNVSNPATPQISGSVAVGGNNGKVAITGNLALVANTNLGQLQVVNIATPSNPLLSGSLSTGASEDVTASGNTAYVSANGNFKIIDILNPALPTLISTYNRPTHTASIFGNYAYTTGERNGIDVVDISNKSNPAQKANIISVGNAKDVVVAGNKIYVADSKAELVIMDIYHDTPTFKLTADKYEVNSGDEVTYTLTLTNPSPNTLTNLNLSDVVPTGTTYISSSASGNAVYDPLAKKLTWTYSTFPPSQIITEIFKVKVN